jgi:hypothetical protein
MALFNFTRTLTLEDLRDIDKGRIERSKDLVIDKVEEVLVANKPSFLGIVIKKLIEAITKKPFMVLSKVLKYTIINPKNKNVHRVIIKVPVHIDEKKLLKQKVEIYCDCADFMYRCAYELGKHHNLFLNNRTRTALGVAINTKPTKVKTSPACKHVYHAISDLVKNYKKYLILK